jgi:hypothetical protein
MVPVHALSCTVSYISSYSLGLRPDPGQQESPTAVSGLFQKVGYCFTSFLNIEGASKMTKDGVINEDLGSWNRFGHGFH